MTILITGANGFIGRNLTEYLARKNKLLTPSSSQLDLTSEDQVDKYFRNHKIDVVVHCAVVGGSRSEEQINNALNFNLRMLFNLLKNKTRYSKIITLGSGAEYSKSIAIKNVSEKSFGKHIPTDDYGLYKYTSSQVLQAEKQALNLRLFGLFGKHEDYRYRFISNAICRNLLGMPITINQNVKFDYVHVDDLVRIIGHFIHKKAKHSAYNIGGGTRIDLVSIAKRINKISNKSSEIIVKKKGLNREYTCDGSLLQKELNKFIFTDFDKSLTSLYDWYGKNIDKIDKSRL